MINLLISVEFISTFEQLVARFSMESSTSTVNHLEYFLLNSGPKQCCLVRICKYVDLCDMANVCKSSEHSELFVKFFNGHVIGLDSFDFTEVPSNQKKEAINEVFRDFGLSMQKTKLSAHNNDSFFSLMVSGSNLN